MRGVAVLFAALAVAAPAVAATGPPASNQRVLTRAQSERLVSYAAQLRTCLVRSGLDVARPHATRKLIALAVDGASSGREVVMAGLACAERIGDPPTYASLQSFVDRIVLYAPKQCLLDKNVVQGLH
jgi:hypothetical protein